MLKSLCGFVLYTWMIVVLLTMLGCSRQSTFDYFGQEPPESIPKVLAPGFISTKEHGEVACTFMPDGKEFYFTQMDNAPGTQRILVSRFADGEWTKPEVAPFSKEYVNLEPHTALFYSSEGDIYWVSTKILYQLKPDQKTSE